MAIQCSYNITRGTASHASGSPKMSLAEAPLRTSKDTETSFPAEDLWKDGPVMVIVLRRPGCLLCREQAIALWGARERFQAAGVRLVLVVHEWIQREIDAFRPEYWGGDLYFDETKAFYKAVHGGSIKKGSLGALLNPFSQAWKNTRRAKAGGTVKDSNLNGDGLTLGGLMIFKKGGEVAYSHPEETFGDHAPLEEVVAAAAKA